jgi:hypothetical protein
VIPHVSCLVATSNSVVAINQRRRGPSWRCHRWLMAHSHSIGDSFLKDRQPTEVFVCDPFRLLVEASEAPPLANSGSRSPAEGGTPKLKKLQVAQPEDAEQLRTQENRPGPEQNAHSFRVTPLAARHLMGLDTLAILEYSLSKGDSTCSHRVVAVFSRWLWWWDS